MIPTQQISSDANLPVDALAAARSLTRLTPALRERSRIVIESGPDQVEVRVIWEDERGTRVGGYSILLSDAPDVISYNAVVTEAGSRIEALALDEEDRGTRTTVFVGTEDEVYRVTAALAGDRDLGRTIWQLALYSDPKARNPGDLAPYGERMIARIEEELTLDLAHRLSAILAG
jgi:hypothetical protein